MPHPGRKRSNRFVVSAIGLLLGLLMLAGCGGPAGQYRDLPNPEQAATPSKELTEVPFYPQERYHCGPAALATVLDHAGLETSPERLADSVYLPERHGTLQTELVVATRRHDHVPYRLEGTLDALLEEIAAGNPVLVLQNLGLGFWPRWHYAVAVGYDLEREEIILRSGRTERRTHSLRHFERTWELADHWAIVVTPPDRLPATATRKRWLEAIAALENRDRLEAARTGYATALDAWPASHTAWFGMGNVLYEQGDYAGAAEHYRTAAERQPDSAAVHHNLAWALYRSGATDQALEAARRSEALEPEHPVYGQAVERISERDRTR